MLIAENVVEVQDGMIEIKAISRACGIKAKVAVFSGDSRLDAVGACIGARGSRIKPVMDELGGERIDIVYYDNDIVNFAKNAITPAKALYGEFNENSNSVELVLTDDQLKLAIGKAGQNVRLASQLIGCNITVIAESEKKQANQEKFNKNVALMTNALDLEEAVAQFLVS
jgi:N utilization substance protein A